MTTKNEGEGGAGEVKEIPPKKSEEGGAGASSSTPKVETRVSRLVGAFQSEIKNLADRVAKLEGVTPAGSLEDEIHREEAAEELENIFDEVGRRISEILGVAQ